MDPNTAPQSQSTPTPAAPVQPTQNTQPKGNGFAIAALVLGIIAFIFGWLGAFNILTAVLAIVFAVVAMKKGQTKGMWIAGLVLGALGLLTSLLVAFVFGAAIINGAKELESSTTQGATQSEPSEAAFDLQAAYDKVQTGMTKAEVETATGKKSSSCSTVEDPTFGKSETCTYGNMFTGKGSISVTYDNDDKVSTKYKYEN